MVNRSIGFSLWLDFVERGFIQTRLAQMVKNGWINGATSNPAIFSQAMQHSDAYQSQLQTLTDATPKERYEALAIEDIRTTARILRTCYDEGNDGFISIEIDPFLAHDASKSIEEGVRLFRAIGEPNVMIKVPATEAGYEVMEALMAMGISVNATLIFSPKQAKACLKAMKKGIDSFESSGGGRVEGVISVFVSRFDRLLDPILKEKGVAVALTGIYNAAKIYRLIEEAHIPSVRTLFASTGVKGDDLPTTYYIRQLYASHSVNTAPLQTVEAFTSQTVPQKALPIDESTILRHFQLLENAGITIESVYDRLLKEGLVSFEESFRSLLESLK